MNGCEYYVIIDDERVLFGEYGVQIIFIDPEWIKALRSA